jgi:hypothetical protein
LIKAFHVTSSHVLDNIELFNIDQQTKLLTSKDQRKDQRNAKQKCAGMGQLEQDLILKKMKCCQN